MVYPPSNRFDFKPLLVALLCLSGAGAGAYSLYLDFQQTAGEGAGPPMAKLERREAKVRRKPSKSFAWNNAKAEEKLFRRDSVQTSVGSAAAIRFNDGTLLELGENSLVVIEDIQHLSLDFLKGAVVLHTAEGDKRMTVDKDGKARFEELPIRLVKPEPLARFFVAPKDSKPVRFSWKPRAGQESALPAGLSLQVSSDRGFRGNRVVSLPIADGAQLEGELPIAEGAYFWRLFAGDRALTDVGQFRVITAAPLKTVGPTGGERLVVFGDEIATQFRWVPPEEGAVTTQAAHELQIARDAEFSAIVARQDLLAASGQTMARKLEPGDFHWRIISRYGDIQVSSRVERFTIARAQKPTLALTAPEAKKAVERMPTLRFSWSSDAPGLEYSLEVQDARGQSVGNAKTKGTSHVLSSPGSGAYRWRVTATKGAQTLSESEWRAFSIFEGAPIALNEPARNQEIRFWEKPVSFEYRWSEDALLAKHPDYSYEVHVSRDVEFKSPVIGPRLKKPGMPSERIALDGGDYYWKVLVVDETGQTIKTSPASKFVYGTYATLAAPLATAPVAQAVFDRFEKDQIPVATWSAVPGAEAYDLTVYAVDPKRAPASAGGVPPGARVAYHAVTTQPTAELKNLKAAHYVWVVRALDRIRRPGAPMAARGFSITDGELLGAPQIISSEVQ